MPRTIWHAGLLALFLPACVDTRSTHTNGNGGNANPPDSLDRVLSRTFTVQAFKLESGEVLHEMTLAYETYGRLAPDGRNAILVAHGFTSNHHAAGKHAVTDTTVGWWDGLIGPGKAIDTDRYFVVSSNMLGSSFGSTAPKSTNPKTGKPYGPDFPDITLRDMVVAQKTLLEGLGVQHLVAVAGPSFGGYQTFQWAVTYPTFMNGAVVVVSAPKGSGGDAAVKTLQDRLATDPNWNGGPYFVPRRNLPSIPHMRFETLLRFLPNNEVTRSLLRTSPGLEGSVVVVSAPEACGGDPAVKTLKVRLPTDPNWNGGSYYDRGGIFPTMLKMRIETLERYGQNEVLARLDGHLEHGREDAAAVVI